MRQQSMDIQEQDSLSEVQSSRVMMKMSLKQCTTVVAEGQRAMKQRTALHFMLARSLPSRSLRSSKGITRSVPRVKTNTGARAFHFWTPSVWNNRLLSVYSATSVATFRKRLEIQLFDLAFPPQAPAYTSIFDGPLMLWKCCINFAAEN